MTVTASVLSCVTSSLPPGQPVPTWSWGSLYLSASTIPLCSSSYSYCWAPWISLSVHPTHLLSASASGLSRATSHQPVLVHLSSLPLSFPSCHLLFFLFSSVLWCFFPARWSRISGVVHASSSTEWSLRYTAWQWHQADPYLSENRSAWLWSSSLQTHSFYSNLKFPICEKSEAAVKTVCLQSTLC